jgi:3-hydroxyacyl-CoA dehydrogenase
VQTSLVPLNASVEVVVMEVGGCGGNPKKDILQMNQIKVVVYGSGLMGRGIAQVCATSGHPVTLLDISASALSKAQAAIQSSLQRLASKTNVNPDKALQNITFSSSIRHESVEMADVVIEAVVEDMAVKQRLLRDIEETIHGDCILATNTSSLSVSEMAKCLKDATKQKFAGLHFFNPVPIMRLVEVVKTPVTEHRVIETLLSFCKGLGKAPVVCKDTPGFIVNRLLIPYLMQAVRLAEEGVATKEDIDVAVKLGLGYPMGPFELLDHVGLDTAKSIVTAWSGTGIIDDRLPQSIDDLVRLGKLGNKTGRGFYVHDDKKG